MFINRRKRNNIRLFGNQWSRQNNYVQNTSGVITFVIFFTTEAFVPICQEAITMSTLFGVAISLIAYSIIAAALAVISLWFGYWKKSASVTIIVGVIVSCIFGSFASEILLAGGIFNSVIVLVIAAASILVAFVLTKALSKKISTMEV